VPDTGQAPPVAPPAEALSRLESLARALVEAGLGVSVEKAVPEVGLRVINPDATDYRDRITCRHHPVDGDALWFFHAWREPISPARDVRTAVADVTAALQPKPGARRDQP
jgi:hypothetical protein